MSHHKLRIYRFQPYNPSDSYSQKSLPNITPISASQSTPQIDFYNPNLLYNSDTMSASAMQPSQQIQNLSSLNVNSLPPWRPMEFSKNMRALKLYSGILGAFLT